MAMWLLVAVILKRTFDHLCRGLEVTINFRVKLSTLEAFFLMRWFLIKFPESTLIVIVNLTTLTHSLLPNGCR